MQGPEHCHIEFCKALAMCTNNKDIFLTILHWHMRAAHLQYLCNLEADLAASNAEDDIDSADTLSVRAERGEPDRRALEEEDEDD